MAAAASGANNAAGLFVIGARDESAASCYQKTTFIIEELQAGEARSGRSNAARYI